MPIPKQSIQELSNDKYTLFEGINPSIINLLYQSYQDISTLKKHRFSNKNWLCFNERIILQKCIISFSFIKSVLYKLANFIGFGSHTLMLLHGLYLSFFHQIRLYLQQIKNIVRSNPVKTEDPGKVDTVFFDKTGTFSTLELYAKDYYPHQDSLLEIMDCYHHFTIIYQELEGDPMELEMFKQSDWKIYFDNQKYFKVQKYKKSFQVIKIFELNSHLQRMSVIALNEKDNQYYLFAKGSPQKIIELSNKKFDKSILEQQLQKFTYEGLRVIGLSYKLLNQDQIHFQRDILESQLNFSVYLL
ncbi:unnamed protein product [Paramecium sonneborni]|uniref:Uncharacterized protein n=1 Tax=Paramecium sonneborni TaxID=65129 RepID=A0A8S1RNE8_9CILI|nr:unnamed protein product [Paramecium sonneborni]